MNEHWHNKFLEMNPLDRRAFLRLGAAGALGALAPLPTLAAEKVKTKARFFGSGDKVMGKAQ